jgi:hypothetical protein
MRKVQGGTRVQTTSEIREIPGNAPLIAAPSGWRTAGLLDLAIVSVMRAPR